MVYVVPMHNSKEPELEVIGKVVGRPTTVTANVRLVLAPQALFAITVMFPDAAAPFKSTVIVLEVLAGLGVQPAGKVQV
jgi:hypothetical protein